MEPGQGGAGAAGLPSGKGGILYCVVARGATVLARHASCVGNFAEISDLVLAKVREQEQPKMTLTQGEFLFHYISSDGVVALAIAGVLSFLLAPIWALYFIKHHCVIIPKR